jgi:hypothetical protein
MTVKKTISSIEFANQLCTVTVEGSVKFVAFLKRYTNCKFHCVVQKYAKFLANVEFENRNEIVKRFNTLIHEWVKEWRYFPFIGSSQVWDGKNVINIKDTVYLDVENVVEQSKSKKQNRINKNLDMLKLFQPSKEKDMWKVYIKEYLPKTKKFWVKTLPGLEFPLPETMDQLLIRDCSRIAKGFLLFCLTHSIIQLRRQASQNVKDSNFYPSFVIGDKNTFNVDDYFSKLVVFVLYSDVNTHNKTAFTTIENIKLDKKTLKNIQDNTKMTNAFYSHIKQKDYGQFWEAAKQMEGTDRYYIQLFKVSPKNFQ